MVAAIRRDDVEHVIGLKQDGQALRSLDELDRIGSLHGPCVSPRQATRSVVKSGAFPLFLPPGRIRELSRTFLFAADSGCATAALVRIPRNVRGTRPVPHS